MFQPFNLATNPENKNAKKTRKTKKEEDKSTTDKQNKQEKEKSKEEDGMTFHIFENELENDYDNDIYHQGENSFDITMKLNSALFVLFQTMKSKCYF